MKIFAIIRFYWGAFVISFNAAVVMIPAMMLFNKHSASILHYVNRFNMFLMGGKLEQKGTMDDSADMYVMNHQGIIDIVGLEALQNNDICWVAKKELFEAPWFGYLLRFGRMISLDRKNKSGLVKLIKDTKTSIEVDHRPVAIFPEGTRTDKQPLLDFKQGANIIAKKLELRVQPIVITGSKWVLNEHTKTGHGGIVKYEFLPTIAVKRDDEEWFDTLRDDMQKVIDDEFTNNHRSR